MMMSRTRSLQSASDVDFILFCFKLWHAWYKLCFAEYKYCIVSDVLLDAWLFW
jgi:hypothetical protein